MNRFVVSALVAEASAGKRIVCLSHSQTVARFEFLQAQRDLAVEPRRVVNQNGKERLEFDGGGWIRFTSHRSSLRGISADVVFIDWDVEIEDRGTLYDELRPIVAASHCGELVRA